MRSDRLLKLAAFLRELPPTNFDFTVVRCGTVGCALGWCPSVFPDLVVPDETFRSITLIERPDLLSYWMMGSELFGISPQESDMLFTPRAVLPWMNRGFLGTDATPTEVAESIEAFVKWKESGGNLGGGL